MSAGDLELMIEHEGKQIFLRSPSVGLFTQAEPTDSLLTPGMEAGQLLILGRPHTLRVPQGIHGRVQGPGPQLVHQPVAYGTQLYSLVPIGASGEQESATETKDPSAGELVFKSPQTGRFYHRPSPKEEPYLRPGEALIPGQAIGMIEVMKTFTTVSFTGGPQWPAKVRLKAWLAEDGSEITSGEPLATLEEG